jgi:hypothetical protein
MSGRKVPAGMIDARVAIFGRQSMMHLFYLDPTPGDGIFTHAEIRALMAAFQSVLDDNPEEAA